jgi:hypothetical protein
VAAGKRFDTPVVQKAVQDEADIGRRAVAESLVPNIEAHLLPAVVAGFALSDEALRASFEPGRSMAAQYAGGAWVAIFKVQQAQGGQRELERISAGQAIEPVRWVLDPSAEHCAHGADGFYGCPEIAGIYPGGWNTLPTVPAGRVSCRGNCILPGNGIDVTEIQAAIRGSYSGLAIKLITESGIEFSVTANHPVLTPKGWLRAQFLDEGDYVVKSAFGKSPILAVNNNHQNMPSGIEQIWRALSVNPAVYACPSSAVMPDDFHGDGRAMNGDVNIILPYRTLWGNVNDTSFNQSGDDNLLHRRLLAQSPLPTERTGMEVGIGTLTAPNGIMISRDLFSPLLGCHLRPLELFGFALSAKRNSLSYQSVGDSLTAYSQIMGQLQKAFARHVTLDKVIKVIKFHYVGHVYDLQTDTGYFLLNSNLQQSAGIVNSNCRCHLEVQRDGKWQRGVYED